MKKAKRVWSDEQRAAAAERCRQRFAKPKLSDGTLQAATDVVEQTPFTSTIGTMFESSTAVTLPTGIERDPEVQAAIDAMTPERKVKLAAVQGKIWQDNGRADGRAAQEALIRHEVEKQGSTSAVLELPSRIGSRELNLIVRTDGTMVSRDGPCVCGAAKREWHSVCLRRDLR